MTLEIKKATKLQAKLRLALIGPSGSGKTYTGLAIASNLGSRIAVIDTENRSASKYSDDFSFDVIELESYSPDNYIQAIEMVENGGYDALLIDSLSHAWIGKGGVLEIVDKAAKRSQSGNSFAAWRDATPEHNKLVDKLIHCKTHLIVAMRSKTEYVLEKDEKTGKTVPRKVGIQPIQRDGLEYEFDCVADLNMDNDFIVGKTRCKSLNGFIGNKVGKDVADIMLKWLSTGSDPTREMLKAMDTLTSMEDLKRWWEINLTAVKSLPDPKRAQIEQNKNELKAKFATKVEPPKQNPTPPVTQPSQPIDQNDPLGTNHMQATVKEPAPVVETKPPSELFCTLINQVVSAKSIPELRVVIGNIDGHFILGEITEAEDTVLLQAITRAEKLINEKGVNPNAKKSK